MLNSLESHIAATREVHRTVAQGYLTLPLLTDGSNHQKLTSRVTVLRISRILGQSTNGDCRTRVALFIISPRTQNVNIKHGLFGRVLNIFHGTKVGRCFLFASAAYSCNFCSCHNLAHGTRRAMHESSFARNNLRSNTLSFFLCRKHY